MAVRREPEPPRAAFSSPAFPRQCGRFSNPQLTCSPHRNEWRMASKGFGKDLTPEPPVPSEGSKKRDAASERLEEMRSKNVPEYSIWLRLKIEGEEDDSDVGPGGKFPWLPVGSMTVPRDTEVPKAIFNEDVYADLLAGGKKMFPNLKDYDEEDIQVGYKPKGSSDDEGIQLAERPSDNIFAKIRGLFKK